MCFILVVEKEALPSAAWWSTWNIPSQVRGEPKRRILTKHDNFVYEIIGGAILSHCGDLLMITGVPAVPVCGDKGILSLALIREWLQSSNGSCFCSLLDWLTDRATILEAWWPFTSHRFENIHLLIHFSLWTRGYRGNTDGSLRLPAATWNWLFFSGNWSPCYLCLMKI